MHPAVLGHVRETSERYGQVACKAQWIFSSTSHLKSKAQVIKTLKPSALPTYAKE